MKNRGMTLVETAAGVTVVGVAVGLASPLLQSARVTSIRTADVQNLRTFGVAQASYELDHQGRLATYSWAVDLDGTPNWETSFEDLSNGGGGSDASLNQAADIIRRGIGDDGTAIRRPFIFYPHRTHNHLVLLDYLGMGPMEAFSASPGDRRLNEAWDLIQSADSLAEGVDVAKFLFPNSRDMGANGSRIRPLFPFMSSYLAVPFVWSPDAEGATGFPAAPAFGTHWLYAAGSASVPANRTVSEVAFPGQKVFMYGSFDYASVPGQPMYYAFRNAKPAQVFFDGSAGVNATIDANFGINPRSGSYANFDYIWETQSAQDYTPPPGSVSLDGELVNPLVNGYYRWTAGGLGGIDFGGKPLDPFGLDLGDPYGD